MLNPFHHKEPLGARNDAVCRQIYDRYRKYK